MLKNPLLLADPVASVVHQKGVVLLAILGIDTARDLELLILINPKPKKPEKKNKTDIVSRASLIDPHPSVPPMVNLEQFASANPFRMLQPLELCTAFHWFPLQNMWG